VSESNIPLDNTSAGAARHNEADPIPVSAEWPLTEGVPKETLSGFLSLCGRGG